MDTIKEPRLDIRHQRIIQEIMVNNKKKEVLVVGAGDCKKDYHLIKNGWEVYSTDYQRTKRFDDRMSDYFNTLNYSLANIFDYNSFPVKSCETVICCEVLEHLPEYKCIFRSVYNWSQFERSGIHLGGVY